MFEEQKDLAKQAPLFVSVAKAAELIGISRTLAYQLCREYLRGRREGIPCERFGPRRILVPRRAIERLAQLTDDNTEKNPWLEPRHELEA